MRQAGPSRILVDSSLWIEYYKPTGRPPRREAVRTALAQDLIATTAMIVVEVLQGASTSEEYSDLGEDFAGYHWLDVTRETAERAARMGFDLRRRGQSVPSTDLLIAAAALEHGCQLWHLDEHFERIAKVAPLRQKRW
jgi:predicted nucleic acid-binding protein